MKEITGSSRRNFIKKLAASSAAIAIGTQVFAEEKIPGFRASLKRLPHSANDNINIALIGAGGMGTQDTLTALAVPGVKLVAICDLYDGRLEEGKKNGEAIFL